MCGQLLTLNTPHRTTNDLVHSKVGIKGLLILHQTEERL